MIEKILAGLLPLLLLLPAPARETDGPNLLIIQTDEHNFRTLGCYRRTLAPEQALMWGKAVVETPNIDRLADEGAICTSFYATTPVCSPSRGALVSGRYPQNTPVVSNNIPLSNDVVTFAEILRRKGYATGFAGKWHLDGGGKPQWAPKRKFGFEDNRYMFNRGHWKKFEITTEGPRVAARKGGKPTYDLAGADEKSFATDFLCDRAVEFIGANKDKPFCYYVSLPDPHGPDRVRPPYDTRYKDQTYAKPRTFDVRAADLPSWGQPAGGGYGQASYYGMVKCIDDNVGKILDALRSAGVLDRTLVVFTSDHGDLRGEHHRHNKGVPYEGSALIPFLLRYPPKVKAGTVIGEALTCVDFLPTALALMGVKTAGKEEGRDASPLFTTGRAPDGWTDVAFMRATGGPDQGWLAALTDRYKLVLSSRDVPWLIDLEKDPDELTNFFLKPERRETVRRLAKALRAYGKNHNDARIAVPRIKADLDWAIEGTGPYEAPKSSGPSDPPKRKKRKKG